MDPPNRLDAWYRTERSQEGQNHTGDPGSIDNTPMQLEASELSGSSTNRQVWLTWPSWDDIHRHLHAIALTGAYHLHKGFRRVTPRRLLPVFTSMTLFELYVGFGLATTAERATRTFIDVVRTDRDLLAIEISAIQYSVFSPNMRASLRRLQESEPEWSNALRQWRSGEYIPDPEEDPGNFTKGLSPEPSDFTLKIANFCV
ncbi:hypothetical protein GY45DRAFT_1434997 [Cubamyces sp. BRFM 1775]|nr:hypothetical protein GY45DRAFT_1434997 [Cubamyces sp. BRFM 1775]